MVDDALALDGVDFSYDVGPVLSNLSHAFRPGRLTAICGPNGSGKSTVFGIATGQLAPSRGSVTLSGEPIAKVAPKARAKRMAMLPQSPEGPAELLVKDLVALGRYAHRSPLAGLTWEDRRAITAGLEATDMANLADRSLAALSGGQRQRAWIAMILAQEAPLLLLDEPTNHIDISHAVETLDLLKRLVKNQGKTVIAILHDINLMASHADDVVLMKAGRITAAGPVEETMTEATLSALYGREVQFGRLGGRARPFIVVR